MDWIHAQRVTDAAPTQRHSGRSLEPRARARNEEQRWRTTTTSSGTTETAETGLAATATVPRVGTAGTVGRPGLATSNAARVSVVTLLVGTTTVRGAVAPRVTVAGRSVMVIGPTGTRTVVRHGAVTGMTRAVPRAETALVVPTARVAMVIVRSVRTVLLVTGIVRVAMGIVRSVRIVLPVMGIVRSVLIVLPVMGIVRSVRIVLLAMGIVRSVLIVLPVMGIVVRRRVGPSVPGQLRPRPRRPRRPAAVRRRQPSRRLPVRRGVPRRLGRPRPVRHEVDPAASRGPGDPRGDHRS